MLVDFHSIPSSETTDADKFDMVLELVADVGRVMFKLFQHPSLAIVKAAGLIMKSIIEVSSVSSILNRILVSILRVSILTRILVSILTGYYSAN